MTTPAGHTTTLDDVRTDLLARLGLDDATSPEDLAAAHESVEQFLASAPRHLGAWARRQASSADEAYTLLTDPAALARTVALGGDAKRASAPGGPATPPVRQETPPTPKRPTPSTTKGRRTKFDPADVEPTDEELAELIASVTPSAHRDSVRTTSAKVARGSAAVALAEHASDARPSGFRGRLILVAGGIALIAVVAFMGYRFGGGGLAASLPVAGPSASPTIDMAAVGAFMQKIAADPKDTASLQGLADIYYEGGDYANASDFLGRILAYDPANIRALLGLGAAAFNGGDSAAAETAWKKVVAIDPKSVEAHYDLGFLYLNTNDLVSVQREWQLVIQLDPGSDVAKNVQSHLDALAAQASGSPSAGSSGAPLGSPAASTPVGSAIPSAAPSSNPGTTPTGSARP